MLFCLNSGSLILGMNRTFISLIPKVKNPKYATKFCPIALCNILYKLVSKVLANRLKKFYLLSSQNLRVLFNSIRQFLTIS